MTGDAHKRVVCLMHYVLGFVVIVIFSSWATATSSLPVNCSAAFDSLNVSQAIFMAFGSVVECAHCSGNVPLSQWTSTQGVPLLSPCMSASSQERSFLPYSLRRVIESIEFVSSSSPTGASWCVLEVPINSSIMINNDTAPGVNVGWLNSTLPLPSYRMLVRFVGSAFMPTPSIRVTGSFQESFVSGFCFSSVMLAEPSLSLNTLTSLPIALLDLTAAIPPSYSWLPLSFRSPTMQVFILSNNNLSTVDAPFVFNRSETILPSLQWLSMESCHISGGDPIDVFVSNVLWMPRLLVFKGGDNNWKFSNGDVVDFSHVPRQAKNNTLHISLARCNSTATLRLNASVTNHSETKEGAAMMVLDVSQNAFPEIQLVAPAVINSASKLVEVNGVQLLNVSLNTVPLKVSMFAAHPNGSVVAVAQGRTFINALRTVTTIDFHDTVLEINDTEVDVSAHSPQWVCSPYTYCRTASYANCNLSGVLELSLVDASWLSIDFTGNYFNLIVQPDGLISTEPIILTESECAAVHPCYVGSYVRCSCSGSSNGSSDSSSSSIVGTPVPSSEDSSSFWQRREVWVVAAVIVAVIVLMGGLLFGIKKFGLSSGSSKLSLAPHDLEEPYELENRVQWSREDEDQILCDAKECSYLFDQYYVHPLSLGDGTTSKVLKVTRKSDKKSFAMKRYSFKADDPNSVHFEWMELFKEFWLLRHADHPNIIRIEEVFISFFDAFLPEAQLSNVSSSNALRSSSSKRIPSQREYYPVESLTDHVTPFLRNFDCVDDFVPSQVLEQQSRSRRYCYIIMSYVPNGTLSQYLDQRRAAAEGPASMPLLCEEEALYLARQVFCALVYLHDPHRRRQLWATASSYLRGEEGQPSGTTEERSGEQSEPHSSLWFHKPDALSNMEGSSRNFASSSASLAAAESGVLAPRGGNRTVMQVLSEDGPILHRDVKPDNLLMETLPGFQVGSYSRKKFPDHKVILTDFGFADVFRAGTQMAHKGAPPIYAAPEVSRRNPLPASDVFSAGVVLFELLTATRSATRQASGTFATNIMRSTFVEKQKAHLAACGVRPQTASFLLDRLLLADASRRCTANEAVAELSKLLAK